MYEGYSDLVQRMWPRLVRTAWMLGCSAVDAEDAAQSALVRCLVYWDRVSKAADRDAYVYRILFNTVKKSSRRHGVREVSRAVVPDRPSSDAFEDLEARESFERLLGGLSDRHRDVVVLRYYHDFSVERTSQILRVPVGTVKSRLSRAMAIIAANASPVDGSRI
jgi:RNA polymerase sigma factor (sigma-70 family)